ncbi:MAG: hypothetical protein ACOC48_03335, partial [Thiohalospira sp.]
MTIEIAFNPLQERFEVADAAIRRDRSYITNISEIWGKDSDVFQVVENYLANLGEAREVGTEEKKQVQSAVSRLSNLLYYPFTALQLSANLDEEEVSEVF